ncbi:uncharacterized protein [Palaemon carinicauda]|uniref:uncharacterized protein n=1 Tax=Palaemon carinicauda TaxID=392227 RepID=UPI0035B61995
MDPTFQQQPQAQFITQPFLHPYKPQQPHTQYGEGHSPAGGGGGALDVAGGGPRYQEQVVMEGVGTPYQRHKVAYVPVYDYQHHTQQTECDWQAREDMWGGISTPSPAGMSTSPPGGEHGSPCGRGNPQRESEPGSISVR